MFGVVVALLLRGLVLAPVVHVEAAVSEREVFPSDPVELAGLHLDHGAHTPLLDPDHVHDLERVAVEGDRIPRRQSPHLLAGHVTERRRDGFPVLLREALPNVEALEHGDVHEAGVLAHSVSFCFGTPRFRLSVCYP